MQRQQFSADIEVETRTLKDVQEALGLQVQRILLDNMNLQMMRQAVAQANGKTPLEASGNITLDNLAAIAQTGVDFISCGALTHSTRSLDISLTLAAAGGTNTAGLMFKG
jgi:nicotinate-nucleotide pyrophosphorylase (carboxylating)